MIASTAPRRPRRRWLAATAAALAVLTIAVTATATARAGGPVTPGAGTGSPSPVAPPASPATTADLLRRLAGNLQDVPADQHSGAYTYHHLRRWILDTTGTPAKRPNTPAVTAIEIRRWEAADGSGLGVYTELPLAYDLAAAEPDHRSTDAEFGRVRPTRTPYRAGNRSSPIITPLATNAAGLARQLAFDPLPDGPQSTLRAVDELYTAHHVTRPTRAAVLRVLADVVGLSHQPDAADRLGRHGFAVTLDAVTDTGKLRFMLVFHPTTGQLLASSQQLIGAHKYLPVPVGSVTYYTLFVDQGRRADLPATSGAGQR
jgi:hypothetical protein